VSAVLGRFAGFGPQAVTFWHELEADNSKAFFDAHRHVYESDVREPLERLLGEVAAEFGDGKVFRPHRDVRFSADRSPYKLHAGAVVGATDERPAAYYTQVSGEGLLAASGYYVMSRDQLHRFREAVAADRSGPELVDLVVRARSGGAEVGGQALTTAPRGYPRDHPRVELLRHKGLTVHRAWPARRWLQTREALRRVTALWREAAELNAWLDAHVGPAEEPPRLR
jgi:uncharacterized protein (TIGR02453 family)